MPLTNKVSSSSSGYVVLTVSVVDTSLSDCACSLSSTGGTITGLGMTADSSVISVSTDYVLDIHVPTGTCHVHYICARTTDFRYIAP